MGARELASVVGRLEQAEGAPAERERAGGIGLRNRPVSHRRVQRRAPRRLPAFVGLVERLRQRLPQRLVVAVAVRDHRAHGRQARGGHPLVRGEPLELGEAGVEKLHRPLDRAARGVAARERLVHVGPPERRHGVGGERELEVEDCLAQLAAPGERETDAGPGAHLERHLAFRPCRVDELAEDPLGPARVLVEP